MSARDRKLAGYAKFGPALSAGHGRRTSLLRVTPGAGVNTPRPKLKFVPAPPIVAPVVSGHEPERRALLALLERVKRDPDLPQWKRDLALQRIQQQLAALEGLTL